MKVTKTSPQPNFQPIDLEITIESKEEFECFKQLYDNSYRIYGACVDQLDIDSDAVFMLESMLDKIGEAL